MLERKRNLREQSEEFLDKLYQMVDDFESQFGFRVTGLGDVTYDQMNDFGYVDGNIENFLPNEYGIPVDASVIFSYEDSIDEGDVYIDLIIGGFNIHEEIDGLDSFVRTNYKNGRFGSFTWGRLPI